MEGNYLEIANSPGMWIACSFIIVVVLVQVTRLIIISFKAGKEIGMTQAQMLMAVRSGFTTALVPAIAILLGLAILMTQLGAPFPWMRLSVIGSVTYELMAAGLATQAMGLKDFYSAFNEQIFTNVVWTMSLGVVFGLLVVAFFTPRIKWLKEKVAGDDEGWMKVLTAAAIVA